MPRISQRLLERYHNLCKREQRNRYRHERLRTEILRLHETGAAVEKGPFELNVREVEFVRPTWPRLQQVLDRGMCRWLRSKISATRSTFVQVMKNEGLVHQKKKSTLSNANGT